MAELINLFFGLPEWKEQGRKAAKKKVKKKQLENKHEKRKAG